jgi:hypothetical protein
MKYTKVEIKTVPVLNQEHLPDKNQEHYHYTKLLCLVLQIDAHSRYVGVCHHGTVRPRVADGGDGPHIRRVAVNILN